jgi:hypothetical protein
MTGPQTEDDSSIKASLIVRRHAPTPHATRFFRLALIQSQEELGCLSANVMDFLNHHFYLGLGIGGVLGLIGITFAVMRLMDTKGEVRRLKRHLSDKLELEADATNRLRRDLQELKQQNENLRIKVANLNQYPDKRLQRELEIYARAERFMVSSSPGFPAVWEEAKRNAVAGLEQEENGNSLPKRVFNALLNRPSYNKSSNSEQLEQG